MILQRPMDGGELLISNDTAIIAFVVILYAPLCLLVYKRLIPRFSPLCKWIAGGMLAALLLTIAMSLNIRPKTTFESWLWNLDQESNIPGAVASTQLALAGAVALISAWLARARPIWQRLYWVGVGLTFLFLGWDEFSDWKFGTMNWKALYFSFGLAFAAATALTAIRSPRRGWIWRFVLVSGLTISALGGFMLDDLPHPCGSFGIVRIDGCLNIQSLEEIIEMIGGWLTLVALLGHMSDTAPTLKPRVRRLLCVFPALWILLLTQHSFIPDIELRILARPAAVQFEPQVRLQGYTIDLEEAALVVRLFIVAHGWYYPGSGYSIHLVDQSSGQSMASRNEYADLAPVGRLLDPEGSHIYRQWIRTELPDAAAANRALWVVLTLWRETSDGFARQQVRSSDLRLLSNTQIILDELVLPGDSPAEVTVPVARFANDFALERVNMPATAQPGENLSVRFAWRGADGDSEELAQFLHFVNQASGSFWNHDQLPLGARLPTHLWYSGLADSETWQVPLPADLAPGLYQVFTGLYRIGDQERVPASDADGKPFVDARVPLGALTIEA